MLGSLSSSLPPVFIYPRELERGEGRVREDEGYDKEGREGEKGGCLSVYLVLSIASLINTLTNSLRYLIYFLDSFAHQRITPSSNHELNLIKCL